MKKKKFVSRYTSRIACPKVEYGCFRWNAAGHYPREEAVRVFKREKAAEAYCERENAKNPEWGRTALVVRDVYAQVDVAGRPRKARKRKPRGMRGLIFIPP